ncbi:PhnD ABC-type phosphate/phosphonate transport system, periplasmic component [Caulobacteraceae bacterium]
MKSLKIVGVKQVQISTWLKSLCVVLFLSGLSACGSDRPDSELTGWQKEVGQLRIGATAGEDSPTTLARWTAYQKYLNRITGLKVEVFQAADYNGIIQAMASGQLEIAQMGGAAYANAREQMGEKVTPFLALRSAEGVTGYYSALVVRADSPYRTLEDLRGKSLGYVDFNSTSGYLFPRWAMRKEGHDPDTFFGKTAMSGGHTQGVLALANGQFDAVFMVASGGTPETGFTSGSLNALARRGAVKMSDYRIIWTAGPMPNSPYVIRTDRPQAFQDITRGAMAALAYEDPQLWVDIGLLEGSDMQPMTPADYQTVVDMRRAEIAERRAAPAQKQSNGSTKP